MEKKKRHFYIVLAKNISSLKTDRIKDLLPIICEEVDGSLKEILSGKIVYFDDDFNGLSFSINNFLEKKCSLIGVIKYKVEEEQIANMLISKTEDKKKQELIDIKELEKLTMETISTRLKSYHEMGKKFPLECEKIIPVDFYLDNDGKRK